MTLRWEPGQHQPDGRISFWTLCDETGSLGVLGVQGPESAREGDATLAPDTWTRAGLGATGGECYLVAGAFLELLPGAQRRLRGAILPPLPDGSRTFPRLPDLL